jgi:GTP pyrophosphokinase
MRTLGHMDPSKRSRIARETMDVYVPIAHRLGLNNLYRELQDLSFSHLFPVRYKTLGKAVKAARGNRREVVSKILDSVRTTLAESGIQAEVYGREKTLFGIYRKMRNKHLSFSQVLDVYGFRIVVDSFANCYVALGTLHALYKPMPGKFKDYIAIPKLNGYQSLHTTLIGPYGTPVEFQIRTDEMHRVAESGVAAHWLYKTDEGALTDLQQRTHAWLQSLLDIQKQTGDSAEFLEHVKGRPVSRLGLCLHAEVAHHLAAARRHSAGLRLYHSYRHRRPCGRGHHQPRARTLAHRAAQRRHRRDRVVVHGASEPDLAGLCAHRQGALGDPALPPHDQPRRVDRARTRAAVACARGAEPEPGLADAFGRAPAQGVQREVAG